MYIYCTPGIDIHPDMLRWAVICDENMAREADNVWINNYRLFCSESGEKTVDILQNPDYFCMPFDVDRVGTEIDRIKQELSTYNRENVNRFRNSGQFGDNYQDNRNFSNQRNNQGWKSGNFNRFNQQNFPDQGNKPLWKNNDYRGPDNRGGNRNYDNNNRNFGNNRPFDGNRSGGFNNQGYQNRMGNYQQQSDYSNGYNNRPNTGSFNNRADSGSFDSRANTSSFDNRTSQYGFDRPPSSSLEKPSKEQSDSSQDFDQYNVPYSYK